MNSAQSFTNHPARYLRIPVVESGKQGKDRARGDDIMEVPNDVVRVMQMNIGRGQTEWKSRKSAYSKHGQKCQGKKHRYRKPDRPPIERNNQCCENDNRRNEDN